MRIGIDYDDVISPFLQATIDAINFRYNKNYTVDDIKGWNMLDYVDITKEQLYNIWTPKFINNIPIKYGARQLIEALQARGHDVYIVTASWCPTHEEREKKCVEELGLSAENVVFIKKKYLLNIDVLIDDRIDNFTDEYDLPCDFERVVFDMPHNRRGTSKLGWHYRVKSFDDIINVVDVIEKNKKYENDVVNKMYKK